MGLTWTMINTLAGFSGTFLSTKVPYFCGLVARRKWAELDRAVIKGGLRAMALAVCGGAAIVAALLLLPKISQAMAVRFLDPVTTSYFLFGTVFLNASAAQSSYLRAFKREPFVWVSLGFAVLTLLTTWYFSVNHNVRAIGISYLAIMALFVIPVGTAILVHCRRLWVSSFNRGLMLSGEIKFKEI